MKRSNKILKVVCAVMLSICAGAGYAQDVHFSQFYETAILRNPSLTGVFSEDYKVAAIYRSQWRSISNPYQTGAINAELRRPVGGGSDFVSYGLFAYYDRAGSIDFQTMSVYPALNYSKSFGDANNSYLSVGFTGGYIQNSFNPNKATFNNQYLNNSFSLINPTGENLTNVKLSYWDIGGGVNFNSTGGKDASITYMIGIAGYHFSTPATSFMNDKSIKLPMRWNGNAAMSIRMTETYSLQLHANYMQQGVYSELIAGGLVGYSKAMTTNDGSQPLFSIYAGILYRVNDAFVPVIKLKYRDYSFGMSYDVNVSTLSTASQLRGGMELTIIKTGMLGAGDDRGKTLCPSNFF